MAGNRLKKFLYRLAPTAFLVVFLVTAARQGLAADFAAGAYRNLLAGSVVILLAAVLLGVRVSILLAREQSPRVINLLLITLFCGVLFYPVISHLAFTGRSFTKVGNYLQRRNEKASLPLQALIRQFPGTYEKYWQDNSILSKAYIHLNAMVKVYLFKVSPNTTVALGKNGFYFEGYGARKVEKGIVEKFDNIADYMGMFPFSDRDLWKWKQTLEERNYWLKKQGVDYVFVLAPTKALVYPEFLPQSLQNLTKGRRRYDQLSDYLHANARVHFVDLLPALLKEKKKRSYPLLFYKTDFHWNFYGSLVAYEEIVRQMQAFFPEYPFVPETLDDFTVKIDKHWAHRRFMNMIGLPIRLNKNEHYLTMVPKPGTRLYGLADLPPEGIHDVYPPKGRLSNAKGEFMKIRMVHNSAAPIPSILLLGDSFLEKCVYYFSANAREVWNYRTVVNFPTKIFAYEKPTFVIQEILNMFILRKPPENPSAMRQEYLAAQFALSATGRGEGDEFDQHVLPAKDLTRVLLPTKESQKNLGYVVQLRLESTQKGDLEVAMQMSDGKKIVWAEERVRAGQKEIYVSIPPGETAKELIFRWITKEGGSSAVALGQVSFRALTH